jgi:hypothetical protein
LPGFRLGRLELDWLKKKMVASLKQIERNGENDEGKRYLFLHRHLPGCCGDKTSKEIGWCVNEIAAVCDNPVCIRIHE